MEIKLYDRDNQPVGIGTIMEPSSAVDQPLVLDWTGRTFAVRPTITDGSIVAIETSIIEILSVVPA